MASLGQTAQGPRAVCPKEIRKKKLLSHILDGPRVPEKPIGAHVKNIKLHHPSSSQFIPSRSIHRGHDSARTMNTKWTKGLGFIVCRCPREYGAWSLSPVMSSYVQFHLGYNSFFPLFITHLFISQLYWTNWGITVQFHLVIYFITHFSQHSGCPAEVVPVFLFHLVKSEPGEPEPGAPGEAQHPQKSTTRPGYD